MLRSFRFSISLLALAGAAPAYAQSQPAAEGAGDDMIIVTATRSVLPANARCRSPST